MLDEKGRFFLVVCILIVVLIGSVTVPTVMEILSQMTQDTKSGSYLACNQENELDPDPEEIIEHRNLSAPKQEAVSDSIAGERVWLNASEKEYFLPEKIIRYESSTYLCLSVHSV
jgi:hypothetical protein